MRTLLISSFALLLSLPALAQRWWETEPLRILDLVSSLGQVAERDPVKLAALKADLLYNAEHFDIMSLNKGLDDQGFFFKSAVAGKQNRDFLGEYLPQAHKRGIRVMIYFCVHWFNRPFGDQHPDWLQRSEDGQPLTDVYTTGTDFCINAPYREWVFQVLRDLAAYPIDGIFYDGPVFRANTCYCRHCQAKFRKAYGRPMPSKPERRGAAFRDLLEFKANSIADFLADSQRILKAINPGIALYMNGGLRGANWATGRLNRVIAKHQDLLGAEGGFIAGDLTRVPLWKPGITAKLLETQAPDKPRVIFSAASHKPWTFSVLPEPELRLLYADSIANAANVWMGITSFEIEQPEMRAITALNKFVAANGTYFKNTRSEARAAIVWSDTTANFYQGSDAQMIDIDRVPQRSEVGNLDLEFAGLSDALVRSGIPFDVIDDMALEQEELDRYRAIFLPNVACMSERTALKLRQYVQRGGNLLATFETSLYDETGIKRGDLALADLFGVDGGRRIVGPTRWDFMKPSGAGPLLDGIKRQMIPSTTYHLQTTPKQAQVLLRFTVPLAGRYDGVPELSPDPALVVNQAGKGRVVYFTGDLGNSIQNFHLPEMQRIVSNAVTLFGASPVRMDNVPASVEVVLRSQLRGERLLLHLVNFTGEMTRPITRILPVNNARIRVQTAGVFTKARTLVRPQVLAVKASGEGHVEFTIPTVEEYEVVVLER